MLHPELLAFQSRLEAAGVVAVRHADHICVRLGLLCSVRVRYDGERLAFEPRVGFVSRGTGTGATVGVAAAAIAGSALAGAGAAVVAMAGAFGVLALGYDALRYLVTEGAITRATLLWGLEHPAGVRLAGVERSGALPPASETPPAASLPPATTPRPSHGAAPPHRTS